MGYYMRYVIADERGLALDELERGLQSLDPRWRIESTSGARAESGDLYLGSDLYGEVEINEPGDGLFDEERDELVEALSESEADPKALARVRSTLERANAIVAIRVLWQGRQSEATLEQLDRVWEWLFANRKGLLQADAEGYYDADGLILDEE